MIRFSLYLSLSPEYLQMFFDQAGRSRRCYLPQSMAQVQALKDAKRTTNTASQLRRILNFESIVGSSASGASGGVSSLEILRQEIWGEQSSAATPKSRG